MLRYSLNRDALANQVEAAVPKVLAQGFRTGDIHQAGTKKVGTSEMGDAVVAALRELETVMVWPKQPRAGDIGGDLSVHCVTDS